MFETSDGYSYKPFDDNRAIFIHIPKCAGVSVNRSLFGNMAGGHATYEDYIRIFGPRATASYFKFTIVRNPWSRLLSAYNFLSSGGLNTQDAQWFATELAEFSNFTDFVLNWVNPENIWKWYHFIPQYHYITDRKGNLGVDFIGRIENIAEDYKLIASRLGKAARLEQYNRGGGGSYERFYTEETKKIVGDVYRRDIDLLGYDFG